MWRSTAKVSKTRRQTLRGAAGVQSGRRAIAKLILLQRNSIGRSPDLLIVQRCNRIVEQLVKATNLGLLREALQIIVRGFVKRIVEMPKTFASGRRRYSSKTRDHPIWDKTTIFSPALIQWL